MLKQSSENTQLNIVNNMTEGILVTDLSGTVQFVSPAAYNILDLPSDGVIGQKFASLFFGDPDNDAFSQTVIDALYSEEKRSETVVPFFVDGEKKLLRMYVTFNRSEDGNAGGYILVFTDLSELLKLRDIAQDFERVRSLNRQLTLRNELLQKTFGMFLSDEVVQGLLDTPGGLDLGGKNEVVTMMMSDLRGFTVLSEQMYPDDLITMLNHYLGVMTEEIQKYGGTIIEFIGDGIMAVFGAPVHSDTHAADAVAAAVAMQAAMDRVNRWNAQRGYPHLEMGIGLDAGEVIVGNVGSKKRMKYGVVGSHVNRCGRIESYTTGGQILISPSVKEMISSPLTIINEIKVAPKGVKETFLLSQVTGIGEPYNVSIKIKKDDPKPLQEPIPVSFSLINEKHTQTESHFGGFTALGKESAVLRTEVRLKLYDNLQVIAGGALFCKVRDEINDRTYLLHYTSVPPGYKDWVRMMSSKGIIKGNKKK